MIVCRNVMIYFGKTLQDRVHELFYDSLEHARHPRAGPQGVDQVHAHEERYEALDAQEKLYRKMF